MFLESRLHMHTHEFKDLTDTVEYTEIEDHTTADILFSQQSFHFRI